LIATETVKVSGRYQISLPSHARRQLGIEAGDRLLVVVQDGMLILLPQPEDFVSYMAGLHREVWQGIDVPAYLNEERAAWPTSDND
jgi:AbrB family looped-hinge helix DNA binding protein